jgi:hypothetical protein
VLVTTACPTLYQLPPDENGNAFNVAVTAQTVALGPALTDISGVSEKISTVSDEEGQLPLLVVHTSLLVPADKPLTMVLALPGFATDEVPLITVHIPDPTEGVLADRLAETAHNV